MEPISFPICALVFRGKTMSSQRVMVVGAGLGGLAAAVRLASAGCSVEVFEAAAEAGGKAGTTEIEGVRVWSKTR